VADWLSVADTLIASANYSQRLCVTPLHELIAFALAIHLLTSRHVQNAQWEHVGSVELVGPVVPVGGPVVPVGPVEQWVQRLRWVLVVPVLLVVQHLESERCWPLELHWQQSAAQWSRSAGPQQYSVGQDSQPVETRLATVAVEALVAIGLVMGAIDES
jgi:hypothetical protein